jgi:hypothetical protein
MIRRSLFIFFGLALLVSTVLTAGAGQAAAATTTSTVGGNALRISPVRSDLTIQPGSSETVDVFVQNLTSVPAELAGVVDDFTAGNNENGQPDILLNGQEAPEHSLKQFVAPISNFSLGANAEQDVKVTINIPKGAAGGYFGVVRFEPASSAANKVNVNLSASVGSLILVTVPGNITEKVTLASFDVRDKSGNPSTIFTSGKSLSAVARFQDGGNVQEEPFGKIILKKGNTQVASYEINNSTPRGNVLPGSIRRFTIPLTHIGAIGKYTIEGNFGYGSNGQLLTASRTFYIVPIMDIVIGVIVLLLIAFLVFGLPKVRRSYDRKIIQKASRAKKR